ncbi:MAG: hypothetical protein OES25_01535 [Acidobacteriota bacterium]|nr:hypothetical protein [Acidobacteriota bacterium]
MPLSRNALDRSSRRRVLILSSSGGGAHLVAAEAIRKRLADDPSVEVVDTIDVLLNWTGPMGRFGVWAWNGAMRSGNSRRMNLTVRLQAMGELVFHIPILFHAVRALRRLRVDEVFDCQVMGTRSLLTAARRVHRQEGRNVRITKVLTEPANEALSQFFDPIRRLPARLRRHLHIWASPPLLKNGETAEMFWRKTCKIDRSQVDESSGFPVRAEFYSPPHSESLHIRCAGNTLQELTTVPTTPSAPDNWETISPANRVVTILMGSQGTWQFTMESVRSILARWNDPDIVVFVYARTPHQRSQLADLVAGSGSQTRIVAMGFVDAATVSALYHRSDATVTRSGGMTTMELLTVGRAPAFICTGEHRESRYHGMVRHEDGNYRYLRHFHSVGAWVFEPKELAERLTPFLVGRGRRDPVSAPAVVREAR